jgi:hypothetical protein
MDPHYSHSAIYKTHLVQTLMRIQHLWETAAHGDSLAEMKGDVSSVLFDVANNRSWFVKDSQATFDFRGLW